MSTTFRSLGVEPIPADSSILGIWYARAADIPIEELQVDDLCRAIRQELLLDRVVPLAVAQIRLDPNAGEMYEGELLSVLARIQRHFWVNNKELMASVVDTATAALPHIEDDVRRDALTFLEMAAAIK